MHTFWRLWLAGQRGRCWRELAPRQIPVGRRSWGIVNCFFAVSGGEGEAAIANHLANHLHDHVSVSQQLQQLAGEAAVPYTVVGCGEVDKHSSDLLFSRKAIPDVLCQQSDQVYGRPLVSKAYLFLHEQWIDDWFDASVDESLEDLEGDTQKRYRECSSPDPGNFELGHAGSDGSA